MRQSSLKAKEEVRGQSDRGAEEGLQPSEWARPQSSSALIWPNKNRMKCKISIVLKYSYATIPIALTTIYSMCLDTSSCDVAFFLPFQFLGTKNYRMQLSTAILKGHRPIFSYVK